MSNWGSGGGGNSPASSITQDEVNALAGTSGAPSASNEYVTDQDARLTSNAFLDLMFFGDGSDGSSSPSSGTVILTRDMQYTTLTPSGTAAFVMNGFTIRCGVDLNISNAPAACFTQQSTGAAGTTIVGKSASGVTAGSNSSTDGQPAGHSAGAGIAVGWGSGALVGTNGASAGLNGGAQTVTGISYSGGRGGVGGIGGAASAGGTPGLGGVYTETIAAGQLIVSTLPINSALGANAALRGGIGGLGGGGGATATTSGTGGGSGAGGGGGSVIPIFARTLTRGASTAAGCIDASGGLGGAGGNGTTVLNQGGGGAGGGGGGGGLVHVCFRFLAGVSKAGAIVVTGGAGGAGGNGGGSSAIGGTGGTGGDGGVIQLVNINTGVVTRTIGSTGTVATVASVQAGTTGGAGGAGTATL